MNRRTFLKWIGGAGISLSCLPAVGWGKEASADVPQANERPGALLPENTSASGFTFENFVEVDSNRSAKGMALAVAERPGQAFNPLVIYGDIGTGKTHLLRAIENRVRATHKSLNVLYAGAEEFVNDLENAIRFDRMPDFRKKYMGVDALLIDDVDYIAGKERSQDALLSIFDDIFDGRQVVLTATTNPKLIEKFDERLMLKFLDALIFAELEPSYIGEAIGGLVTIPG